MNPQYQSISIKYSKRQFSPRWDTNRWSSILFPNLSSKQLWQDSVGFKITIDQETADHRFDNSHQKFPTPLAEGQTGYYIYRT